MLDNWSVSCLISFGHNCFINLKKDLVEFKLIIRINFTCSVRASMISTRFLASDRDRPPPQMFVRFLRNSSNSCFVHMLVHIIFSGIWFGICYFQNWNLIELKSIPWSFYAPNSGAPTQVSIYTGVFGLKPGTHCAPNLKNNKISNWFLRNKIRINSFNWF